MGEAVWKLSNASEELIDISKFKDSKGDEEFDGGGEYEYQDFIVHLIEGTRLKVNAVGYVGVVGNGKMINFIDEEDNALASIHEDWILCIHLDDPDVLTKMDSDE